MARIRLVIFDVAGTIVRDGGEVLQCFSAVLQEHGMSAGESELKAWKGASKREVLRHFLKRQGQAPDEGHVQVLYDDFCRKLQTLYRGNVRPVQGAEDVFDLLRRDGIRLATTTGFESEIQSMVLREAGWEDVFDANISSDQVPAGRPAPSMIFRAMEATGVADPGEVINVGDTPLDLQAGSNAGVRGIVGVLTGAHGREELARERHTHIVDSIANVPAIRRELDGCA
jgi:phosphonatase-like hydrolase